MRAWEEFVKKQEELLGKQAVTEWLRPLKVVHFDSGNLYLEAKNSFQILWFEEHIRPLLKTQLLNNNYRPIKVHLTNSEELPTAKKTKKEKLKPFPAIQFAFDPIDPAMTWENFVIGEDNQVIFRFFHELISPPLQVVCNPIYIWAEGGCGKTHLLTALTHTFKSQGLNALYAKADTFTEHVVSAIRSSEMQSFRKAYRNVDVLLIDDVHLFARKNATQEEFFHTFNTLHTAGRPIILTAKCPPASLEEIEPRLVSRFEWGINIHLAKLKSSEHKQMLLNRCAALNFPLQDKILDFLIQNFKSTPSLNRALEALVLRSHLDKNGIDNNAVEKILSDLMIEEQKHALNSEKILSTVSAFYGVCSEDLMGKSQNQESSLPRQIAMYFCRSELKLTFHKIGQIFKRDHSTVMTSIRQIENRMKNFDKDLISSINEIKNQLS